MAESPANAEDQKGIVIEQSANEVHQATDNIDKLNEGNQSTDVIEEVHKIEYPIETVDEI